MEERAKSLVVDEDLSLALEKIFLLSLLHVLDVVYHSTLAGPVALTKLSLGAFVVVSLSIMFNNPMRMYAEELKINLL